MLADPPGSVLYSYFQTGELKRREGGSITEGKASALCSTHARLRRARLSLARSLLFLVHPRPLSFVPFAVFPLSPQALAKAV